MRSKCSREGGFCHICPRCHVTCEPFPLAERASIRGTCDTCWSFPECGSPGRKACGDYSWDGLDSALV
jgi:hypothetical protein